MPSKIFPRLPLVGLAFFAVVGIGISDKFSPDPRWFMVAAVVGILLAFWGNRWALGLAVLGVFGVVHSWQWQNNPARLWADSVAGKVRSVQVTGILVDEPLALGSLGDRKIWRGRMRVESWDFDNKEIPFITEVLVQWPASEAAHYGDRWCVTGDIQRPQATRNPGEFDAATWLARQSVFLELKGHSDESLLISRGNGSSIKAAALMTRAWMLQILGVGMEDAPALRALIAGITLGVREAASDQFADAFRQTGTFHLFSVSGLHVGMFALLLWTLLRPLGFTRRKAVLLIVPLLFFYSLVTGASPPSLRAAVMISVAFGGFLLDRPNTPANSLAAAALLLLAWDTNQLFSPGFQLSFSIVTAIFLLAPPLQNFFAAKWRPDPFLPRKLYTQRQRIAANSGRELAMTLGVSTAAWLGSLPLTAALFHLLPVLAIPANLLAVPLAFAILAVAMLSLLAGSMSLWLTAVFNNANWGLASLLLAVVQGTAALPGSYVYMPPGWMQPPGRLTIFDVGSGGAQLLRTRQSAWLFDAGNQSNFLRIIGPGLRAAGVGRLDALVMTHGDVGHTGGATVCFMDFRPHRIIDSALQDRSPTRKTWHAALRDAGFPKSIALSGDFHRVGADSVVRILFPDTDSAARLADDQALVVAIETQGFRVLLMSDSGAATEDALLRKRPQELPSDILVLGRHGKDIFATEEFLNAVHPQIIVLAPKDLFHEDAGEEALRQRLQATKAIIFDQAESGAVTITFHQNHAQAQGFVNNQAAELRSRERVMKEPPGRHRIQQADEYSP